MRNLFLWLAAAAALALASACGGDSEVAPQPPQSVAVSGVGLDNKTLHLAVGHRGNLTAQVRPAGATNRDVAWASDETSVATVSGSGATATVNAIAAGTATITVRTADGNWSDDCRVTVTDGSVPVAGVDMDRAAISLVPGGSGRIEAMIQPPNATDRGVTWTTSNAAVAKVAGAGPGAMVTGVADGSATITATTSDGGMTATCAVTVAPYSVPATTVALDKASVRISVGRRSALAATLLPPNAAAVPVWTSGNPAVATVTGSGLNAVVNGVSNGVADIAVTVAGGLSATCNVTVMPEPTIFVTGNYGLYLDGAAAISDQAVSGVFVDANGNVHAAGQHRGRAAHYLNGEPTALVASHGADTFGTEADGVFVAPSGDVYVAGCETFAGGSGIAARLWKNGQLSPLQGVDETGRTWSRATAVRVFNNDVYVVGYNDEIYYDYDIVDFYKRPVIWKNGQIVVKADMADLQIIDFDIDSGGVLHVLCYNEYFRNWFTPPFSYPYTYWTVQPDLTTWANVSMPPVGGYALELLHIFADGDDVYLAGNAGSNACYWKNGARTVLPLPAGTRAAEANDIHVCDGQEYIVGTALLTGSPDRYQPALWVGGEVVADKAIAKTFASYDEALSHSILVQQFTKAPSTRVSLSSGALSVPVRHTGTLTATVFPSGATCKTVAWESSDPAVASVAGDGNTATVGGLAVGTAAITARTPDGATATCQVSVVNVQVTGVSLQASQEVCLTRSSALIATIAPHYATNTGVTWTSGNPAVATVSGAGPVATVTGVGLGSATITARTQDGNFAAACAVRVVPLYQFGEPTVFMAGRFGLYMDDRKDYTIGDQWFDNARNTGGLRSVVVDNSGNVHAVGQHYDPSANPQHRPVYYRNGARTLLPMNYAGGAEITTAYYLQVAGDGSVYITGDENGSGGEVGARLWKVAPDGAVTAIPLQGLVWQQYRYSLAREVRERNGDVYVAGSVRDENLNNVAVIWKNGVKYELPGFTGSGSNILHNMNWTSDGDLYVFSEAGMVYKVAPDLSYMKAVQKDAGAPVRMHVNGNDVYLAGYLGDDACYWKNGTRYTLPRPAGATFAEAGDLRVYDGHVYVAGLAFYGTTVGHRLELWIDGRHMAERSAPGVPYEDRPFAEFPTPRSMDVGRRFAKVPATSVGMSSAALTVPMGTTANLTATALPATATNRGVVWTSSNPAVAPIVGTTATGTGGTVTIRGLAEGAATITALSADGPMATCAVTVYNVPVQSISIPPTLGVGRSRSVAITAAIEPPTALNKNIAWTSSNPDVATVSGASLVATVRGIAVGSATITARTEDGGFTANCHVTVAEPTAPAVYMAGLFGLYVDGLRDADIGEQRVYDVVVDGSNNVHAAGSYYDAGASPQYRAAYYRNGARTDLPANYAADIRESGAYGLWVAGDGTVYIAGYVIARDQTFVARLWKVAPNGAVTQEPLQGAAETGGQTVYSTAWAVRERDGDVYVAGGAGTSNDPRPVIWKNGEKHQMPGIFNCDWFQDMGFAADGTLYVLGYDSKAYRVAGDLSAAEHLTLQDKDDLYDTVSSLCVDGNDYYVVGFRAAVGAWWWKNGVRNDLVRPEGRTRHEANDVFIHEGRMYISGQSLGPDRLWRCELWIDGAPVDDARRPDYSNALQGMPRPISLFVKW